MESIDLLAARLQEANYAYHNTEKVMMSDDEYDRGLEELRSRCPTHPFLSVIGASAEKSKKTVLLPYTMASLDKVRYGEKGLVRFLKRCAKVDNYVITEKLDGLSALYVCNGKTAKLYLRGDGVKGVDVSFATKSLGIPTISCVVRGEILLSNEKTPEGSIGRSLVNGWLHREASTELANCHFLGYQVLEPKNLTREQQLGWLHSQGFHIPQTERLSAKDLTEEKAKEILVSWRALSKYPLDGIVIGTNTVPNQTAGGEAKNPDDAVAFKAALDEQRATTNVVAVEWNLSRQGIWVPRINIEPVVIGGARIQWLAGHNASAIDEGSIGPGARIMIRRSGDVIPTLETVVSPAPGGAAMPDEGSWTWDGKRVQAIAVGDVESPEKAMQHGLSILGVEGIGPGLVKKIVDSDFDTMDKLYNADPVVLATVIGAGRGPALLESLHAAIKSANQMTLLLASNKLPRGVGERKLRSLYAIDADAKRWVVTFGNAREIPTGWSRDTMDTLLGALPSAFRWIEQSFGVLSLSSASASTSASSSNAASVGQPIKYVVFTGVRDKALQDAMGAKGWELQDNVTKQTNLVVIADGAEGIESGKTKKAKQLTIEICTISKFRERC